MRVALPTWLRAAGLTKHADNLTGSSPIVDRATLARVWPVVAAAGAAAWDAAGAVAWDAAWAAAWDAAWAAAWAAAGAVAGAVVQNRLRSVVEELQPSAWDLLDRMIAAGAEDAR